MFSPHPVRAACPGGPSGRDGLRCVASQEGQVSLEADGASAPQAARSGAELLQTKGVGHQKWQQLRGGKDAQPACLAGAFPERRAAIRPDGRRRPEQQGDRVPGMSLEQRRRGVIACDRQDIGLEFEQTRQRSVDRRNR